LSRILSANSLHLACWFSDEGVTMKGTVPSPPFTLVAGVSLVLLFSVPGYFTVVVALVAAVVLYLIAALTSSRVRKDYSMLPVEELVRKPKVTTFAWSEVDSIDVQGRRVLFSIGGRSYRASMPESDVGEFARLIESERATLNKPLV
jgi:hypothetical protein